MKIAVDVKLQHNFVNYCFFFKGQVILLKCYQKMQHSYLSVSVLVEVRTGPSFSVKNSILTYTQFVYLFAKVNTVEPET